MDSNLFCVNSSAIFDIPDFNKLLIWEIERNLIFENWVLAVSWNLGILFLIFVFF